MNAPLRARSWLFVPGDSERKLAKALDSSADRLILDLEDSVAEAALPHARQVVAACLRDCTPAQRARLWVRVNANNSPAQAADLAAIVPAAPAGLMLPKATSAADCKRLAQQLDALEQRAGLAPGAIGLLPIATETPAALLSISSWQVGAPRLAGLAWGAEDLATALGASRNRGADGRYAFVFELARAQCLLAARAAGVAPIDTVFTDFRDHAGLAAECAETRASGFAGKLAIHPAQIDIINAGFTPSAAELAQARRVVAAFGGGTSAVAQLDGRMIDRPHLRQAEQLLAAAGEAVAGAPASTATASH